MKIDELKARKRELGYTNEQIAERSGVPLSTVQKVFGGTTASPRLATLRALERVLFPERRALTIEASDTHTLSYIDVIRDSSLNEPILVRESSLAYQYEEPLAYGGKQQGEYTLEDYLALPDTVRAELIDGRLYYLAAPTYTHQFYGGQVFAQMTVFRNAHEGPCMPLMSPLDVQLDCDDKTVVQPDVVIVCDRDKFRNGRVFGAPDFVMEVLSPSTRQRDLIIKLNKYWQAGVREYWIVDPREETVTVYRFDLGIPPVKYTFADSVPVGIWDGRLCIDFPPIRARAREFFRDSE